MSKAAAAAGKHALPALGETRCYWALMDAAMNFRYIDPVLRTHMNEQADGMLGKNLVDFIHPEEKAAAQEDFAKFKTATTIFGSVTRCRYARVSKARRLLGAEIETPSGWEDITIDDNWANARIVASLVAENTVLVFFHVTKDVDPKADNDDKQLNNWTNWCGPRVADVEADYFTPKQVQLITSALSDCRNAAEIKPERSGAPAYVFQILATKSDKVFLSWPPSKEKDAEEERYPPAEYAALARPSMPKPREKDSEDGSTSCTNRSQSKHPIIKDGGLTTIESVVIHYQQIAFACFSTNGVLLNSKSGLPQFRFDTMPSIMNKRPNEEGETEEDTTEAALAIKRLRAGEMSGVQGPGQY